MTREQIIKLSHSELIKQYQAVLTASTFTIANAILLKQLAVEIMARKDIKVMACPVELEKRLSAPMTALTTIDAPDKAVDINMLVMDKETIPEIEGVKKYAFGYVLDPKKTFDGDNVVKTVETYLHGVDYKVDSVVTVKVHRVTPIKGEKLYGITIDMPLAFTAIKARVDTAIDIIRKAYKAECLKLDVATAIDLNKCGIVKVDVDGLFGVKMDKQFAIIKRDSFAKNGVFYCIVYPADEIDTDGDSATAEEVQKACWKFMEDHQHLNFMHADPLTDREVAIVECGVARVNETEHGIKKGDWWMAVKVKDGELKKMIETGEITGFSMEGTALPGD